MPVGVYIRTKPPWNLGLTKETDSRVAAHGRATSAGLLRSSKAQKASRENIKKAFKVAHLLPSTLAQIEASHRTGCKYGPENIRKAHALPRTEKQRKASRENVKKGAEAAAKLPRTSV